MKDVTLDELLINEVFDFFPGLIGVFNCSGRLIYGTSLLRSLYMLTGSGSLYELIGKEKENIENYFLRNPSDELKIENKLSLPDLSMYISWSIKFDSENFFLLGFDITKKLNEISNLNSVIDHLKTQFYAFVHEIKTPVTIVGGFSRLLKRKFRHNLSKKEREYLSAIRRESARLEEYVQHLVNYSLLERQNPVRIISVKKLIKEVYATLKNRYKLSIALSSEVPLIKTEHYPLKLIFSNLILNSCKYSKGGAKVEIECEDRKNNYLFRYRDYGKGLNGTKIEGFFDSNRSMAYRKLGEGMGLFIIQKAVEQLGGKIWADNKVTCGTCFYFTLPKDYKKS